MSDKVTVLVDEEYGYRFWYWDTGKTPEQLIKFWESLDSIIPYFSAVTKIPGDWVEIMKEEEARLFIPQYTWTAHIHWEDDSWLHNRITKQYYFHKGFKEE